MQRRQQQQRAARSAAGPTAALAGLIHSGQRTLPRCVRCCRGLSAPQRLQSARWPALLWRQWGQVQPGCSEAAGAAERAAVAPAGSSRCGSGTCLDGQRKGPGTR